MHGSQRPLDMDPCCQALGSISTIHEPLLRRELESLQALFAVARDPSVDTGSESLKAAKDFLCSESSRLAKAMDLFPVCVQLQQKVTGYLKAVESDKVYKGRLDSLSSRVPTSVPLAGGGTSPTQPAAPADVCAVIKEWQGHLAEWADIRANASPRLQRACADGMAELSKRFASMQEAVCRRQCQVFWQEVDTVLKAVVPELDKDENAVPQRKMPAEAARVLDGPTLANALKLGAVQGAFLAEAVPAVEAALQTRADFAQALKSGLPAFLGLGSRAGLRPDHHAVCCLLGAVEKALRSVPLPLADEQRKQLCDLLPAEHFKAVARLKGFCLRWGERRVASRLARRLQHGGAHRTHRHFAVFAQVSSALVFFAT